MLPLCNVVCGKVSICTKVRHKILSLVCECAMDHFFEHIWPLTTLTYPIISTYSKDNTNNINQNHTNDGYQMY